MSADLRRDSPGSPSVASTAKPIDDGGTRLLVWEMTSWSEQPL